MWQIDRRPILSSYYRTATMRGFALLLVFYVCNGIDVFSGNFLNFPRISGVVQLHDTRCALGDNTNLPGTGRFLCVTTREARGRVQTCHRLLLELSVPRPRFPGNCEYRKMWRRQSNKRKSLRQRLMSILFQLFNIYKIRNNDREHVNDTINMIKLI